MTKMIVNAIETYTILSTLKIFLIFFFILCLLINGLLAKTKALKTSFSHKYSGSEPKHLTH